MFIASLTLAAAAATASVGELPRVVVVLEENIEGKKATTTSAEVALIASLNKDGYRLVSGEAADALRKAQAVSMALGGQVPDVLSSLDADLVVLGQVDVSKIGTIEGAGLVGYRSAAIVKVVKVDTAQIVEAFSVEGKGNDFSDAGAAQKAQKNVGEELAKTLKAAVANMARKPKAVDLVVHGVPDRTQLDSLKTSLNRTRNVTGVVVRQSGKGLTKIELQANSGDADSLATELEKGGVPLDIIQVSASSILARFDMRRGVRLGAVVEQPTVKLASAPWVKGVLPDLVTAELANVTFLDVVDSGGDVSISIEAEAAGKKDVALTIIARDASKAKIFTASGTGKLEELPALVSTVVKKLDEGFLPAVARAKPAKGEKREALARAAAAAKAPKPVPVNVAELRIEALKLENLFPAKVGYYQNHAVGSLVLQHSDAKGDAAVDVTVSVYVPRFMQLKSDIAVGTIQPGKKLEVPLKIVLDNNTVFAVEENTPTQAEVVVEYVVGGGRMTSRRVSPLLVYGKRAIDWSGDAPITAFVTPNEETVRTFARSALVEPAAAAAAGNVPENVVNAVALFEAMSSAQLKYVKDPTQPGHGATLDTVQFPRETLVEKAGDCDDLSVLYASLLESVGVETAFFLVPGHVLIGVAAGVPPEATERVSIDDKKLVMHGGKAYVPVETTALGKSFRDAWAQGVTTIERAARAGGANGLEVRETRTGWALYPPAALPRAAGLQIAKADPKRAAEELKLVVAERDNAKKARLEQLAMLVRKEPAGASAHDYAAILARNGDVAGAKGVLEAALAAKKDDMVTMNNLANVAVLSGDHAGAVAKYRAILDKSGDKRGDVLTNLGIAYTQAGDQKAATEAFSAALAAGATSVFLATGFEKAVPVDGKASDVAVAAAATRASDEQKLTTAEQELKLILAKALEERKKRAAAEAKSGTKPAADAADRFANPMPSGARRGDDPASKLRTAELLRWLD